MPHSRHKKYFLVMFIFFVLISINITLAAEWYEGGNLFTATLSEWRKASQQNKLATCAEIISEVFLDNYFKLPFNETKLKEYANQLLLAINAWAGDSNNDDAIVNEAALISMLQLEWIDENYLNFISKKTVNNVSPLQPKTSQHIHTKNEKTTSKTSTHSETRQKVKVAPKPKLMSKKASKEWVKNNVHLRLHFPLEDMKYRLGDYQATTIGNIERYYFPRINMTFFVIKSSQEFIGFSESKPSQNNRKELTLI